MPSQTKSVKKELEKNEKNQLSLRIVTFFSSFKLNRYYWLNNLAIFFGYASIWSFIYNGNDIISSLYNTSIEQSGRIISLLYINYIIFAILTGLLIKYYKKSNMALCFLSIILGIGSFAIFNLLPSNELQSLVLIPVSGLGAYYGIFNICQMPIINVFVPEKDLAKALGMTSGIISLAESIGLTVVGIIKDKTLFYQNGYFFVLIFLIVLAILQFLSLIVLYVNMKKRK